MDKLGTIVTKPGVLPEGGGQVNLEGTIRLNGWSAAVMIARVVSGPLHVFLDINFECVIEENLLLTGFTVTPSFDQKCGVSLDVSAELAGDIVCADTYEDLVISNIGISLKPGSAAMGVDKATIEDRGSPFEGR